MSQISFADAEYAGKRKKTRREVFLEEMELVVPWKVLLEIIEPHYPVAGRGRRPYALESMLRVHLMQNWFALSDPAMEEALYEIASLRSFARLSLNEPIPDETTILNFRHLLEANDLAEDMLKVVNALLARKGLLLKRGSIVDATIIAAPSSTKNADGQRDPEMHQTKKGNQWFFGMKAHIAVDADSGLVHTVTTTAANEADVEQVGDLLHGKEEQVWADSGYRGAQTRVDRDDLQWHIAARPSDIAKLPEGRVKARVQKEEHRKASVRAKVIVSTGLGSTAWLKSVVTGSLAIASLLGAGRSGTEYTPIAWDSPELAFAVREPFPSRTSSTSLVYGHVQAGQPLRIRSRMPESGIIFSDGIEADFLRFTAGMEATVSVAGLQGQLVH